MSKYVDSKDIACDSSHNAACGISEMAKEEEGVGHGGQCQMWTFGKGNVMLSCHIKEILALPCHPATRQSHYIN